MDRGKIVFALVAASLALLFVRLGIWQLDRHGERSAANEQRRARLAMPVLTVESAADLAALPAPGRLAWRRVRLRGRWDYRNELLLRPRSHEGRPAIELLTPLLLGPDTAVLVLRGWLPAPDALHAPIRSARGPSDSATVGGLALLPPARPDGAGEAGAGGASPAVPTRVDGEDHLALRRVELESTSDYLPYTIAPFYVMQIHDAEGPGSLRTLSEPALSAGPHLAYAIQWFAFAGIALVGTGILLTRDV